MAKRQKVPLPEPAERVLEQFFLELATVAERDESRRRLSDLHDALHNLEKIARKFAEQIENTARVVVRIANEVKENDDDPVAVRLWFEKLSSMVDALRAQLPNRKPASRGSRKKAKWTLDTTLLSALVAFGNKREYPVLWPIATKSSARFLRLLGQREAGPDWLFIFLLYRIIEAWRISTGLWAPDKLDDFEIGGDPEKCFHLSRSGSSLWSVARKGGSGRRSPIELKGLAEVLFAEAPEIGPTLLARRLLEQAEASGCDHPVLKEYLRVGGEKALESTLKGIRQQLLNRRKLAATGTRHRRS